MPTTTVAVDTPALPIRRIILKRKRKNGKPRKNIRRRS